MKPVSITHYEQTYNALHVIMAWLGLELTLTLLITMIIQHYRHTITHYEYVHNALWMRAFSKVLQRKVSVIIKWS